MPASPHEGHADATLSLVEETADGSRLFQSWTICACALPALRARLGPPAHESYATKQATIEIGRTVLGQRGSIQFPDRST
jgi:hypothetical protein